MKSTIVIFLFLFVASCIKEPLPECPYQYSIRVFVKDMNYFNSDDLGMDIVDEDLPFRQYVSQLYYTLQRVATGENAIEPVFITVSGNEKEVELILNNLADGAYLLTVWGNVERSTSLIEPGNLHNYQEEGTDTYLGSITLQVETGIAKNETIGLERTKGKLVVTVENLPDEISRIAETITSVYKVVDEKFTYTNNTEVKKEFIATSPPWERIATLTAPSSSTTGSTLSLFLYEAGNPDPVLIIPPIDVHILRNELSIVAVHYNPTQGKLEIWININNEWSLISELAVDFNE